MIIEGHTRLIILLVLVGLCLTLVGGIVYFLVFALSVPPPSSALVRANSSTCIANPVSCTVGLSNEGTADTWTTPNCTLSVGAETYHGLVGVARIKAGGSTYVTCVSPGWNVPPKSNITGSILLSNDAVVRFSGTTS